MILFSKFCKLKPTQVSIRICYKTHKSTNNESSNFGLIVEIMDLSCILLNVKAWKINIVIFYENEYLARLLDNFDPVV